MKILLITSYSADAQHVGARRWKILAPALLESGFELMHIATDNALIKNRAGSSVSKSNTLNPPETPVTIIDYPFQYKFKRFVLGSLRRINALLAIRLAKPDVNLSAYSADTFSVKSRPFFVFFNHFIAKFFLNRIPAENAWADRAFADLKDLLARNPPNVIIASYPSWGPLFLANKLSATLNIPWIADIRDPIALDPQLPGYLVNIYSRYETSLLASSSRLLVINKTVGNMLVNNEPKCQKRMHIVHNPIPVSKSQLIDLFNSIQVQRISLKSNPIHGTVHLGYIGTIHSGSLINELLNEINHIQKLSKTFAISYYGHDIKKIENLLSVFSSKDLSLNSYVQASRLPALLSDVDILIIGGFKGVAGKCVQSGKVFDYIKLAKPILAICQEDDELSKLIISARLGKVLQSPSSLPKLVNESPNWADEIMQSFNPDIDYLSEYCQDIIANRLDGIIRDVII
jgi:hypothetical protein